MKTSIFLYVISIVILGAAIFMVVEYPGNTRFQLISGGLTFVGFVLNIVGYTIKKQKLVVKKRS